MHESYNKWLEDGKPKVFCQCGCNNEIIIKKYCLYHGIPKYIIGHSRKNVKMSEEQKTKISKSENGKIISNETREKLRQINLGKKHSEESKTKNREASKLENLSEETLRKRSDALKGNKNSLGKHPNEETIKKISGSNSSQWKGGLSFLPYCYKFNKKLKESIRKLDDYICQMPGCLCTQLESLILYKKTLIPHHIHYDKPNCAPDLITLCIKHNNKVNNNRNYWEGFFTKILEERGLVLNSINSNI